MQNHSPGLSDTTRADLDSLLEDFQRLNCNQIKKNLYFAVSLLIILSVTGYIVATSSSAKVDVWKTGLMILSVIGGLSLTMHGQNLDTTEYVIGLTPRVRTKLNDLAERLDIEVTDNKILSELTIELQAKKPQQAKRSWCCLWFISAGGDAKILNEYTPLKLAPV